MHQSLYNINMAVITVGIPKWLRGWTANPLCFACAGSNPAVNDLCHAMYVCMYVRRLESMSLPKEELSHP